MERRSAALLVTALYAALLTLRHASTPAVNELCARDFVHPAASGSCLCGANEYCLCTPSLAVDAIVELVDETGEAVRVLFILRGDGRGLAMVGGFLKVGESAEAGVRREVLEETGLRLVAWHQWCVFSAPERDPRRHTAALVFVGQASASATPVASDDAKTIRSFTIAELQRELPRFAFDHGRVVAAYLARFHPPRKGQPRGRQQHAGVAAAALGAGSTSHDPEPYAACL